MPAQPAGKLRGSEMTTHDDLRLAVEPASGGSNRRGMLPRSLLYTPSGFGSSGLGRDNPRDAEFLVSLGDGETKASGNGRRSVGRRRGQS